MPPRYALIHDAIEMRPPLADIIMPPHITVEMSRRRDNAAAITLMAPQRAFC